jgi:adenylate kinase family enzyme
MAKINRIMIFGKPGSGKTTLTLALSKTLNLPIYHLDKYFFVSNWVEREKNEFLAIKQKFVNLDRWIIDGNATQSLEMRFQKADVAIYMSLPRFTCIWRVIKRTFTKDYTIDDRAPNCKERLSLRLIRYLWNFDKNVELKIQELQAQYPEVKFYKVTSNNELKDLWREMVLMEEEISPSLNHAMC